MGNGQWAMGNGQWAMGNGQWAMGNGQWAMGNGQWVGAKNFSPCLFRLHIGEVCNFDTLRSKDTEILLTESILVLAKI